MANSVVLSDVRHVDGRIFTHIAKSQSQTERLCAPILTSDTRRYEGGRRLTSTNIVERLIHLKNNAYWELCGDSGTAAIEGGKGDLGLDVTPVKKKRKCLVDLLDGVIEIQAPTIGDVQGVSMHVICTKHNAGGLWMEATVANIEYMQMATLFQLEHGAESDDGRLRKRKTHVDEADERKESPINNVSFSYAKKAWVAKVKDPESSSTLTRYFKIKKESDPIAADESARVKAEMRVTGQVGSDEDIDGRGGGA